MKSKTMFFGAAATAIALSAVTVSTSPAQALSLNAGDQLDFSGLTNVSISPTGLNFGTGEFKVTGGTGGFQVFLVTMESLRA